MYRRIATAAFAAAAAGLAVAAPGSAATAAAPAGYEGDQTSISVVAHGSIVNLRGNRHQVHLSTWEGRINSGSTIRSYYCPSGASISPTWVSSKCTYRSTFNLTDLSQNNETTWIGKVSRTGLSGVQNGPVVATSAWSSRTPLVAFDVTLYNRANADGVWQTSVSGTVGGRSFGSHRSGEMGSYD